MRDSNTLSKADSWISASRADMGQCPLRISSWRFSSSSGQDFTNLLTDLLPWAGSHPTFLHTAVRMFFQNATLKLSLPCLKRFDVACEIKFRLLSGLHADFIFWHPLSHTSSLKSKCEYAPPGLAIVLLMLSFPVIVTSTYASSLYFHWKSQQKKIFVLRFFFFFPPSSSSLSPPLTTSLLLLSLSQLCLNSCIAYSQSLFCYFP